ncbi:unnamed protein product [Camellia sinensis]
MKLHSLFYKPNSKNLTLPPGSTGWPLIGETLEFLATGWRGHPEKFVFDRISNYSSYVFKTNLLGPQTVVFAGAAGNKFLFSNENRLVQAWWPSSVYKVFPSSTQTSSKQEADIADKILGLLIGGHGTASSTCASVVMFLAELPHVYQRVYEEQMEIAKSKAPGELLNWDDIKKMKYSWNVACEVMRLAPPLQGAFREAVTDFMYNDFSIPKGCKLYCSANSAHKNSSSSHTSLTHQGLRDLNPYLTHMCLLDGDQECAQEKSMLD